MARARQRRRNRKPGRIFKRGERCDRYYTILGGVRRSLGTSDPVEAHKRLAELIAQRRRGSPMTDVLVDELCQRFQKDNRHSRNHHARYDRLIKVLTDTYGRRRARDVRADQLQALLHDERLTKGGSATRNRLRTCLHRLFEYARELGATWPNPVSWRPEREHGRPRRALTAEELRNVLHAAQEQRHRSPPYLYGLILLAVTTGARRGELMALRGRDLDRSAGTMTLHSTKNGSHRVLQLPPEVVEALPQVGPEDVFFPHNPERAWRTLLRDAGIEDPTVCFHSLRHTFTTLSARAGMAPATLREVLGHESLDTTTIYLSRIGAAIPVGTSVLEKIGAT